MQHNPAIVRDLIARYDLALDPADPRFVTPDFLGQTIIGQRRALNDLLRLQLYGVPWALTGIDQDIPETFTLRQSDFEADVSWQDYAEPVDLTTENLAFDALAAGMARAGDVPVLLVNEPMFVSNGQNSDLRYNFFYPRWAYDAYHMLLTDQAEANGWHFVDLWDALPAQEFTDSPVHYTPTGARLLAEQVGPPLLALANGE